MYDAVGNLLTVTNAASQVTTMTYDANNRLSTRRIVGNPNNMDDDVYKAAKRILDAGGENAREDAKKSILDWIKNNPKAKPERIARLKGAAKLISRRAIRGGAVGIVIALLWPDPVIAPGLDVENTQCR
jgi:YD repeat-containing protein